MNTDDAGNVDVEITITAVERCAGSGSLIAQAVVTVDVAGIPLELFGVQVRRVGQQLGVQLPQYRHWRRGIWMPAARWKCHPEIHQMIADKLLATFASMAPDSSFYIGEELAPAAMAASRIPLGSEALPPLQQGVAR